MSAAESLPAALRKDWGVRLFAVYWLSLLTVDAGKVLALSAGLQVVLVAAVVAACSLGQRNTVAFGVAVTGWLFVTGFVVNDGGELRLTGAADLGRLGLLLVVAWCAGAVRVTLDESLASAACADTVHGVASDAADRHGGPLRKRLGERWARPQR